MSYVTSDNSDWNDQAQYNYEDQPSEYQYPAEAQPTEHQEPSSHHEIGYSTNNYAAAPVSENTVPKMYEVDLQNVATPSGYPNGYEQAATIQEVQFTPVVEGPHTTPPTVVMQQAVGISEPSVSSSSSGYPPCKRSTPEYKAYVTCTTISIYRYWMMWSPLLALLVVAEIIAIAVYGVISGEFIDPILCLVAIVPAVSIVAIVYLWKYGSFIPKGLKAKGNQPQIGTNRMVAWVAFGLLIFFVALVLEYALLFAYQYVLAFIVKPATLQELRTYFPPFSKDTSKLYTLIYTFYISFVVAAVCEEFAKYIAATATVWLPPLRRSGEIGRDSRFDHLLLSLIAAATFATLENQLYMLSEIDQLKPTQMWMTVGARMVLSVPLHCFTGMMIGGKVGIFHHENKSVILNIFNILWLPILLHGFYDWSLFVFAEIMVNEEGPAVLWLVYYVSFVCVFAAGVRALWLCTYTNKRDRVEDSGSSV